MRMRAQACGLCGGAAVGSRYTQRFPYGVAPNTVELSAEVWMYDCLRCGFAFTDHEGEEARDAAVAAFRREPGCGVVHAILIAVSALLISGCDFRCHTSHNEISYQEAYTEHGENCVYLADGDSTRQVCVPYSTYHPARCAVTEVCDVRCKALDQGRAEAHAEHATLHTPTVNLAPNLCADSGAKRGSW